MNKLKAIYVSSYAAAVSIVVTVADTIGTEFSPAFKTWLANFTGHHWVTKSWVSVISFALVFAILHLIVKEVESVKAKKALLTLEVISVLGFVVILGFFLYEFSVH